MAQNKHKLTKQQMAFVDNYMVHFNAKRAAEESGYKNPMQYSYELLRKPQIKEEIEARAKAYSESRLGLKDRVIEELSNIAFSSLNDVGRFGPSGLDIRDHDDIPLASKSAIAEYTVNETDKGINTKIRFHNKTQALDILGKHLGLYKEQEIQINVEPYIIRRKNGEEVELGISNKVNSNDEQRG